MLDLFTKIVCAEKYFGGTTHEAKVQEAKKHFLNGDMLCAETLLDQLPTKEVLLGSLVEKLRNKPVYKTLKKILRNEKLDGYTVLKGLSSLFTHTAILCEKGEKEYHMLLVDIYERIGTSIYKIS